MTTVTTKWNVGDKFWVPRVHYDYIKKVVYVDGEEYTKEYKEFIPSPKEKIIRFINIRVHMKVINIIYSCNDIDEETGLLPQFYDLESLSVLRDYDDAMRVSKAYADKKEHYYGL